jgi:hypothetical protein
MPASRALVVGSYQAFSKVRADHFHCCRVRGAEFGRAGTSMDEIRAASSARCTTVGEQDPVRDTAAKWKQEYEPTAGRGSGCGGFE